MDDGGIEYSFQVFYNTICSGCCVGDLSDIESYLSQLFPVSSYVVCPGIREYPSSIRFKTKNLVVWKEPLIVTSQRIVVNGMLLIMLVKLQTPLVSTVVKLASNLFMTYASYSDHQRMLQPQLVHSVAL